IYPEYYASVQRPISLAEIRSNVAAGAYQDVQGFKADMKLLFENARAYYREGSWMAIVAEEMEAVFQSY
ncbi:Bromodomain-containing protein, partial [Coprinopsis sp. MPI-PUGE-AT-0042]